MDLKDFMLVATDTPNFLIKTNELVFQSGDIIIETGDGRQDVFLVHSSVLKEKSMWFAAVLKDVWTNPAEINFGNKKRQLWRLKLYFDRESQMGLLQSADRDINDISRESPKGLASSAHRLAGPHLAQWRNVTSDTGYSALLGVPSPVTEVENIPRLQFFHNEQQQEIFVPLEYRPPTNTLSEPLSKCLYKINTGADPRSSTYKIFWLSYSKHMPLMRLDHKDIDNVSHEDTRAHWTSIWSGLLLLLYGMKLEHLRYGTHAVRTAANIFTLAKYHQCDDVIAPGLETMLTSLSDIGKQVSENPEFFLVLAYEMKSVSLYIDAVKHVVGSRTLTSGVRMPSNQPFSLQHPYKPFGQECYDPAIIDFLLEARYNMLDAALQVQNELLGALEPPYKDQHDKEVPARTPQIARMILMDFIANGYPSKYAYRPGVKAQQDSASELPLTIPGHWSCLWQCKEASAITTVFDQRDLFADAAVFGVDWVLLGDAMLELIQQHLASILDDYVCSPTAVSKCNFFPCNADGGSRTISYQGQLLNGGPLRSRSTVCSRHGHRAMYHDVDYSTILHTWGDADHIGSVSWWEWPESSTSYDPRTKREGLPRTSTVQAGREEIIALGLKEYFMVLLDEHEWGKHEMRANNHVQSTSSDLEDYSDSMHQMLGTPPDGTRTLIERERLKDHSIDALFKRIHRKNKRNEPAAEAPEDVTDSALDLFEEPVSNPPMLTRPSTSSPIVQNSPKKEKKNLHGYFGSSDRSDAQQ